MRVVLDTSVLISAFATRGLCEDVLRAVLAEHEFVVSKFVLDELGRVLSDKLQMPAARVRAVTTFIRETALVVKPGNPAAWPTNDPDDQWIVATATSGKAQVIVSGDRDLQSPPADFPIQILTPREFWAMLK